MKVAFLFGGLPHYYVKLLNKLNESQKGLEVIVYYPATNKSLGNNVFQDKKNIGFKTAELQEGINYFGKPKILGLKEQLKIDKPDILIVVWPYTLSIFLDIDLIFYCKKNKIKIVEKSIPYQVPFFNNAWNYYKDTEKILDENLQPLAPNGIKSRIKYLLLTYYRKYQFNMADAHVCYLPKSKDIYGSYGVDSNKIHIILNSPITKEFTDALKLSSSNLLIKKDPNRIIHIGRLVKWKKVHLLLDALFEIKKTNHKANALILGDGPELESLKQQVKILGIESSVEFTGGVYDPNKIAHYAKSASVFVLAGTGGLAINDAMSLGLPVICSECDGTEEYLVKENTNGLFFETDNTLDLTKKIQTLLNNPNLAQTMGKESLRIINDEVNEDIVIENYLKAFDAITSS